MRSIQEIFDAVIDSGLYSDDLRECVKLGGVWYDIDNCMCLSVTSAKNAQIISDEEARAVHAEIEKYLGSYSFLLSALRDNGLEYGFDSRLAIYRDWVNRPTLSQTEV